MEKGCIHTAERREARTRTGVVLRAKEFGLYPDTVGPKQYRVCYLLRTSLVEPNSGPYKSPLPLPFVVKENVELSERIWKFIENKLLRSKDLFEFSKIIHQTLCKCAFRWIDYLKFASGFLKSSKALKSIIILFIYFMKTFSCFSKLILSKWNSFIVISYNLLVAGHPYGYNFI